MYRKLRAIKELDARRRMHVPLDTYAKSPSVPNSSISREVQSKIPDDEAQRQQLLHLLMVKENRNASLEDNSSTYRIDLPWDTAGGENRPRSGSLPNNNNNNNKQQASGSRLSILAGRERSNTAETFKDPRERRREQIEQSGILAHSPALNSAGLSPAWHSSSPRYG